MKRQLLEYIVCPDCEGDLRIVEERESDGEIVSGALVCDGGHRWPIKDSIPRFVGAEEYSDAFGLEWNEFRTAHLDSFTGLTRLRDEFEALLGFPLQQLEGKLVLDAGCGLGRFSEIVLNHGGTVVAFDMSIAIDAAYKNLNHRGNIFFMQADLFHLPLRKEQFDLAYSTGVLHHTPDPPRAFRSLPPLLKPGGKVMIMVYGKYNKAYQFTVNLYRRFTTRLPQRVLLKLSYITVPLYYVGKIPVLGQFITRILIPVSVDPPNMQWRIGNTFDLYSPKYAFTYDHVEVYDWFRSAGLTEIAPTGPGSGVCFIGTKPATGQVPDAAARQRAGAAA